THHAPSWPPTLPPRKPSKALMPLPRTPASGLLGALLLLIVPVALFAQKGSGGGEPIVPEKIGKELHAYRVSGQPPHIDGNLDDEVWTLAQSIDDFVQNEPDNMAAPLDRTTVQVAYDDRALYVAVRCFTKNP